MIQSTSQEADTSLQSKTLIVIAGPTAVGKTAVSIKVAQSFNSVIVSADSRQCYRELNIGVARPTEQELQAVPHYFIASHSIFDEMNAAWYENYALLLLKELFTRHYVVVLAGGTGLYIKALLEGMDEIPAVPASVRTAISENYKEKGIAWLQEQLLAKDPHFAVSGEMKNPHRMMRALEVVETTGKSVFSFRSRETPPRDFNVLQIGLEMPREILYDQINLRVDTMMQAGLEQEARTVFPYRHLNALKTVGYRELFEYFEGKISLPEAINLVKQHTRNYAKRQMTWFKKQEKMQWFGACQTDDIIAYVKSFLAQTK